MYGSNVGNNALLNVPYPLALSHNPTTQTDGNLFVCTNMSDLPNQNDVFNICTYNVSGSG